MRRQSQPICRTQLWTTFLKAHIRANRSGQARYLTMPFFAAPNHVLSTKGERPIPNQTENFDELIAGCLGQLGLDPPPTNGQP